MSLSPSVTAPAPAAAEPGGPAKVTVNLLPRAVAALEEAASTTGDSRADALNRSVQLYALLSAELAQGKQLLIVDPATGHRERVMIL